MRMAFARPTTFRPLKGPQVHVRARKGAHAHPGIADAWGVNPRLPKEVGMTLCAARRCWFAAANPEKGWSRGGV